MHFADLPPNGLRVTRRRLLLLGTMTAAGGLLAASGGARVASASELMAAALAVPAPRFAQDQNQTGGATMVNPAPQVAALQVNAQPTFGAPTDIASGWDGTLWAIDGAGAPHQYDPEQQTWQFYGSSIDATAAASAGALYAFRGAEVVLVPMPPSTATGESSPTTDTPTPAPVTPAATPIPEQSAGAAAALQPGVPQPIGNVWPNLARTFKLGVNGAATFKGVLYLFSGGRFQRADGTHPPVKLTDVLGWPKDWSDGLVDLVIGWTDQEIILVRGTNYVSLDPTTPVIAYGSAYPLSNLGLPQDLVSRISAQQVDGVLVDFATARFIALAGPSALVYRAFTSQPLSSNYLPKTFSNWPITWHPILQQAPSGRQDGLWSMHADGTIVHHDGSGWLETPGKAASVAAGIDGSAFCIGYGNQANHNLYRWDGSTWQSLLQQGAPLAQIAVGDTSRVWVRDTSNTVYHLDQSKTSSDQSTTSGLSLQPVAALGKPVDIAANADGSVWSCDGNAAHRFISEAALPPEQVQTGGVMKVASSAFGNAYFLAKPGAAAATAEVHQYTSPYVFKSSQAYWGSVNYAIAPGLSNLYLLDAATSQTSGPTRRWIAAVDAHTGQEVSRSQEFTQAFPKTAIVSPPTFDPVHEVVYVALAAADIEDTSTPGTILALDARDLSQVRWQYQTPSSVDASPALFRGLLVFGDRTGLVSALDTNVAQGQAPTKSWGLYPGGQSSPGQPIPLEPRDHVRLPTPVLANGRVTGLQWSTIASLGTEVCQVWSCQLDGSDLHLQLVPANGQASSTEDHGRVYDIPVVGRATFAGTSHNALFFKRVSQVSSQASVSNVIAVNVDDYTTLLVDNLSFEVQTGIGSGLAYDPDGLVWFGAGNALYGVDATNGLQPKFNTAWGQPAEVIETTPIVYTHRPTNGQPIKSVWFTQLPQGNQAPRMEWVTPGTSTNLTELPTGATFATSLALGPDGLVYLAGAGVSNSTSQLPQVMGIRIDQLVQNQRDFIIESQLMQDFDDPSQPTHNPKGSARYQTHLTVIDNNKAPQPNASVKLWADQPMTIRVGNQSFQVGPADSEYASVTTGPDGKLTVVSGYLTPNATDAPDLFATPLRVWTSFMDPYERILVYPDREFHARLASAHADANNDDPTRPNLATARTYGGGQLFTDAQQSQGAPGQVATAIGGMTAAVGTSGGGGGGARAVALLQRTVDTPGRYTPYNDLAGMQYSPVNVRGQRPASVLQTTGLHLSTGADGKSPLKVDHQLSPGEAANRIDGLQGQQWTPSGPSPQAVGEPVGNIFTDFWDWLKGAAATITDAIVSVGQEIVVGIRLIVNGIVQVFQQVIHALEDAVAAIGAFFKQLLIDIESAIQALGAFFHFDEIKQTQQLLIAQLTNVIDGVANNPAYPGLDAVIKNKVIPAVNSVFQQGEAAIDNFFNQAARDVGGTTVGQMPGQGSSEHTAYTVKPKNGSPASSQSTQCTWALDKFKAGVGSSSSAAVSVQSASQTPGTDDPVSAFIEGFLARIEGDGDLSSQWQKAGQGFQNLFQGASVGDFLRQGLAALLQLLAALLDSALVVANAFVDGLMDVFVAYVNGALDLARQQLDIPVLSWLYQTLFGQPLTILNAVTLVAAIPITLIWRIAEGEWPSQSLENAAASLAGGLGPTFVRFATLAEGIQRLMNSVVAALHDAATADDVWAEDPPQVIKALAIGRFSLGVLMAITSYLRLMGAASFSPLQWAGWFLSAASTLVQVAGFGSEVLKPATGMALRYIVPAINAVLGLAALIVSTIAFVQQQSKPIATDLIYAGGLASSAATMAGPVQFVPGFGLWFIAAFDFAMWLASGAVTIVGAFEA